MKRSKIKHVAISFLKWTLTIFFAFCVLISLPINGKEGGTFLTGLFIFGIIGIVAVWLPSIKKSRRYSRPVPRGSDPAPEKHPVENINEKGIRQSTHSEKIAPLIQQFNEELSSIPAVDVLASVSVPDPLPRATEIKFSTLTSRTSIPRLFPFAVVDVETTGLDHKTEKIIEVSAIRYDKDFTPTSCFSTLINPNKPIPKGASRVNHITDDMVSDMPSFSDISSAFSSYISGCNIVGHNLIFDLRFLNASGAIIPGGKRFFDTLDIAKHTLTCPRSTVWDNDLKERVRIEDYDVENYKLTTLCDYYKIYRDDAHRSLSDCYATAKIFEELVNARVERSEL